MSSNSGEKEPNQSDKLAQEIEALARQAPMLIIDESGETREIGTRQPRPSAYPVRGLGLLRLYDVFPEPGVSTTQVTEQSTNADLKVFEYLVKADVTPSDAVEAIKQQLRPDDQQ